MLRKIFALSAAEYWLLLQAIILLPVSRIAIRWLGLKQWQSVLARLADFPGRSKPLECKNSNQRSAQARKTARMVDLAARRGVFSANCLQRSLVLWWLLKRQSIHTDLKIGVRLVAQQCEAHAWVEYWGEVLNDSVDVHERFVPFAGAIIPAEAESR